MAPRSSAGVRTGPSACGLAAPKNLLELADALIQRDPPMFVDTERARFGFEGPSRHDQNLGNPAELQTLRLAWLARRVNITATRGITATLVNHGRGLARSGQIEEAIAKFEEALALDPELDLDPETEVGQLAAPKVRFKARTRSVACSGAIA